MADKTTRTTRARLNRDWDEIRERNCQFIESNDLSCGRPAFRILDGCGYCQRHFRDAIEVHARRHGVETLRD
jgi:hypothetical protein